MYEHVVVEHLPQTQHNTAPSALHRAARQLRADKSATTQAELARANMLSIYIARCVPKTNEKIEICPAKTYNYSQSS